MAQDVLLVEKKDGVATLTLNRPEQMNALSLKLRWKMCALTLILAWLFSPAPVKPSVRVWI